MAADAMSGGSKVHLAGRVADRYHRPLAVLSSSSGVISDELPAVLPFLAFAMLDDPDGLSRIRGESIPWKTCSAFRQSASHQNVCRPDPSITFAKVVNIGEIAGPVHRVAMTTLPIVRLVSTSSWASFIVSGVRPSRRVVAIGLIRPSATNTATASRMAPWLSGV